jgi:hypothetical protein
VDKLLEVRGLFTRINTRRQATATTYEKYVGLKDDFNKSWIVWYDEEKIRSEILLV